MTAMAISETTATSACKGIQQPVADLSSQCGIQSTSNQLTDALNTF
jgi:hypothetical protein